VTGAGKLRLGALLWNQYTDWPSLRDAGVLVDELGYDSLWTWDHLYPIVGDPHGPMFEGYMTLAAWAALTKRVTLGLMVGANTFRNPALVAKMVTTLDHVSGGRAYLGIGGAWFETEHTAFGVPFGRSPGERLGWFDEAVALIHGMLHEEAAVSARGPAYRAHDVRNEPRPLQPHLPILIGGSGPRKTLPLIARHGDMWNAYGTPEELARSDATLRAACGAVGRDEREIERTVNLNVVIRGSRAEAERDWARWVEAHIPVEDEQGLDAGGSLGEVAEQLIRFRDIGFGHPILLFRTPFDTRTMDRLPELRSLLAG
jgi:alkanesulfonate monooxygenase SsuD/methylene tetrahydromethanopterin reductase-like flavin-dependent oxidoreductase (luciferase family)